MSENTGIDPYDGADPDLDEDTLDREDDVDTDAMRESSQAGDVVDASEETEIAAGDTATSDDQGGAAPRRRLTRLSAGPPSSLRDMLEGHVPSFLVHRSHFNAEMLPELLTVARRQVAGRAGVGAVIRLSKMRPVKARAYLDLCASATMKVADPEIYALDGSGAPDTYSPATTAHHAWASSVPAAPDPAWIRQVLDAQADAGANVFLSATGWVSDTNGRTALAEAMDWVRATRAQLADEDMFVNLTLPSTWLTTKNLRDALKEELVESNEPLWWLRFYWPIVDPRYGQLHTPAILAGYRDLASTAAIEDKVLILPNSGLTGWAATAWGAQGFSTGMSWSEQMYGAQRRGGAVKGRPKPPRVERFFDRTILHSIPHAEHLALRGQPNHLTCGCRFCRRLAATIANGTYHQPTADLHYLLECAQLTALLGGRRPGHTALREVRDAQTFIKALPTALTGNLRPQHLDQWETLLP
ncbi:hypothetical protein GCM10009867_17090 [Pedococcus aerophilus]|uniref:Uncharacterized protein n=1 Tax=Pedococcus aerophilus TaxID=436356 RepID=A0ABN3UMT2_9MICO